MQHVQHVAALHLRSRLGIVAYPNPNANHNPVKRAHGSYPVQTTVALHMYITDRQLDLQAWRKKAKL